MKNIFKRNKKIILIILFIILSVFVFSSFAIAEDNIKVPNIDISFNGSDQPVSTVQIMLLLTILTLAPSILIMMTSFTRIIIIFSFLRRALSLQSTPPNQVIITLALFITFFVMTPTFTAIYNDAYIPLNNGEITQQVAIEKASVPLKAYMLRQVRAKDLALFVDIAGVKNIKDYSDVSMVALIPAFMISEIKTGFEIGFLLFIPFIVIDMIVASTLMALGMMMLPPVMISLPFKILLFIMVDGWNLLIQKIILTIR
ncbi:flagellar type III secretion system pore protein FliP [Helicovermis profundi]|uniref:Flagellar biosynthetic protein FliP n=1 Tax=Helicovermis profundi TaxID=3065157 RepID=A0AAU9E442_9FIRM|nr:flagellar type III secretion system pore protein FliP [Clostridia bacterium S502]